MKTQFGDNAWRHLAAWPAIAALAVLNGVVREKLYLDRMGEEAAHRISTFPLIAAIFGAAFLLAWRWPLRTARQAWALGLTWLVITEAFEFGLGRLEGRSWGELFHEYNLFAGRIGYADPANELNIYAPSEWLAAVSRSATDISSRVLSCSWRETPTSLRLRLELDNSQGDALDAADADHVPVTLGYDVVIRNGLTVPGTGDQLAGLLRANIAKITTRYAPGRSTVVLDCDGPWEQMARYASPGAWSAPSGTTRRAIFRRVAGRAGLAIVDSGALAPSTAWTTDTPAFAIAPGESAAATLRRLLAPTPDFLRVSSSDGGFEICGFDFGDDPPSDESAFGFLQPDTSNPNPYLDFSRVSEREPNWTRAVGPDRYADSFADADIDSALPFPVEPLFELVRDLSISSDAEAEAIAVNALARRLHLVPQGELIAPLASQFDLYDVVSVALPSSHGSLDGAFRIVERGADYRRDPKGQPAYNSVFSFARR